MEEKRIYVVLPATVQVATDTYVHNGVHRPLAGSKLRHVLQPLGRQIAQACHVVSKLRHLNASYWIPNEKPYKRELVDFEPITTVILQARDSNELLHNFLSLKTHKLESVLFSDENEAAYGPTKPITALAVLATPDRVKNILDYLPLWGS